MGEPVYAADCISAHGSSNVVGKGDSVIVSALAHYTEFLAVECAGGVIKEVPLNENNIVTGEGVAQKIEEVKGESGKLPALIMIDHFDYMLDTLYRARRYS